MQDANVSGITLLAHSRKTQAASGDGSVAVTIAFDDCPEYDDCQDNQGLPREAAVLDL